MSNDPMDQREKRRARSLLLAIGIFSLIYFLILLIAILLRKTS